MQRGLPRHLSAIEKWCEQPRVARRLRADLPRWNQLHSALDAIHQTHTAVETYNHSKSELNEGERFLAIYGLLQALVVQQDALCHLAEALQTRPMHLNRHKRLVEIRNIRNWTVGHPTKVDRNFIQSHHAIRRPIVGRGGFALFSAFDDGRTQYTYVPLPQLARLQRRVISALLRDILAELHQRDQRPPVIRATPRVQVAEPRVAPVASRWKQKQPLRKPTLNSPKLPSHMGQAASQWQGRSAHSSQNEGRRNKNAPQRLGGTDLRPVNAGQRPAPHNPRRDHVQANGNGKHHANGNGKHRANGNGKHRANGNGKHHDRTNVHPERRTWMEKVNPPPLLPARRAARLAAQAIQ